MRWKCTCTYDGTDFCGWQSQANHRGVQDAIEKQLAHIFKRFVRIHGSSRTDAGVHAYMQVFHFDAEWRHGKECLLRALNSYLERTLRIIKIEPVSDHFHARFSVKYKHYGYYFQSYTADPFHYRYVWDLPKKTFNLDQLNTAAQLFLGTHNFCGFSGKVLPEENVYKTIVKSEVKEISTGYYCFEVIGTGFLYRMVRMMMGALMMLVDKKIEQSSISNCLSLKKLGIPIITAPARGLFLKTVCYK